MTMYHYGKCLLKWEKREKTGVEYQAITKDILYKNASISVFPTNIMLPHLF